MLAHRRYLAVLLQKACWRVGPVTMSPFPRLIWRYGILKPKPPNACRYRLLGGASREKASWCIAWHTGHTIDDVLEDYARRKEQGSKQSACGAAFRDETTYGMAKGQGAGL